MEIIYFSAGFGVAVGLLVLDFLVQFRSGRSVGRRLQDKINQKTGSKAEILEPKGEELEEWLYDLPSK